jgi:hypothetical protein
MILCSTAIPHKPSRSYIYHWTSLSSYKGAYLQLLGQIQRDISRVLTLIPKESLRMAASVLGSEQFFKFLLQ